jgi:hypothetical protein
MSMRPSHSLRHDQPREPRNLRRWYHASAPYAVDLFTCARPGRSQGKYVFAIDDASVHQWVRGLPQIAGLTIVSLLGRKTGPLGRSEYVYYSFCGGFDTPPERLGRPTFQQWLDRAYPEQNFGVIEHPTYDGRTVPKESLALIAEDVNKVLTACRPVVLVDSGGVQRTAAVCNYMGFAEARAR